MFHPREIADELAGIRSEINALKLREKMLREVVLSDPDSHAGQHHEVVVKKQKERVLLRDRLPAHILENPAYWEEREVPQVTLRERDRSDVVDLSPGGFSLQARWMTRPLPRVVPYAPVIPWPRAPKRRSCGSFHLMPKTMTCWSRLQAKRIWWMRRNPSSRFIIRASDQGGLR